MKQFYLRLNGSNAASALALAQRALRRSAPMGHPYYWAAYVYVGQIDADAELASISWEKTS
jgi:CHAT domain-containing protein